MKMLSKLRKQVRDKIKGKEIPAKDDQGALLMVVRPTNVKKAIKMANMAKITQIWPEFDEMMDKCGPYHFQGFLSVKGYVIFDRGAGYVKVGNCKPGDSFISEKQEKENDL